MDGKRTNLERRGLLVLVDADGAIVEASGNLIVDPQSDVGRSVFDVCGRMPELVEAFRKALNGEPVAAKLAVEGALVEAQLVPRVLPGGARGAAMTAYFERSDGDCTDAEQLARSASLLNATLESTFDGLLVVDCRGKIARYNQRFLALWKLGADVIHAGDDEAAAAAAAEQLEDPDAFLRAVRERYADPESEGTDILALEDGRVFERYTQPQRLDGRVVGRVWRFPRRHRARAAPPAHDLPLRRELPPRLARGGGRARRGHRSGRAVRLRRVRYRPPLRGRGPEATPVRRARRVVRAAERALAAAVLGKPRGAVDGRRLAHVDTARRARHPARRHLLRARQRRAPFSDDDLACGQELGRRAALAIENARLYRAAREASQARDEFLAVAAHEIRGPLTVLRLAAQQLGRARGMPEAATRPLAVIVQQDRRLARFVDELLDVTEIRAGKTTLKLADVDLGEVIRTEVLHQSPELGSSGSSLTVSVGGHVVGFWDRSKLTIIVSKLLSNAIKFGLSKPIKITASAEDGTGTLEVSDQGVGIPAQRLDTIFSPFERAVSARNYGGLGLGLYVVHELVTAMGGLSTSPAASMKGRPSPSRCPSREHHEKRADPRRRRRS